VGVVYPASWSGLGETKSFYLDDEDYDLVLEYLRETQHSEPHSREAVFLIDRSNRELNDKCFMQKLRQGMSVVCPHCMQEWAARRIKGLRLGAR